MVVACTALVCMSFLPMVADAAAAGLDTGTGVSAEEASNRDEGRSVAQVPSQESPSAPSQLPVGGSIDAEPESLGWMLFTTFLSLGAIVVLIYLTLNFGLRRLMVARGTPFGGRGIVKLVERVMLDQKRALFVVQAAGEYLLVGAGEDGLSLIARLNAPEVERVLQRPASAGGQLSPFLQKLLQRKGDEPPAGKV